MAILESMVVTVVIARRAEINIKLVIMAMIVMQSQGAKLSLSRTGPPSGVLLGWPFGYFPFLVS